MQSRDQKMPRRWPAFPGLLSIDKASGDTKLRQTQAVSFRCCCASYVVIPVKAVLCDLDGTLLNSNAQHAEAWQRAFAHFGIETKFEEVVRQIGKGGDNLIPVFVPEADRGRLQNPLESFRTDLFRKEYLPDLKPFPGARELLVKMRQAGIRIGIASSSNKQDLETFKRILNIEDLVEKDTSGDDADRSKPAPDIFEAALGRVGLSPREVLALGDTPWDIEAADKAQVKTVAVMCGGWSRKDLEDAGALEVYADVAEIVTRFASSAFVARR